MRLYYHPVKVVQCAWVYFSLLYDARVCCEHVKCNCIVREKKNTCMRKNVKAVGFSVAGAVGHNPCAGTLHYACRVEETKGKLKDMRKKLKD